MLGRSKKKAIADLAKKLSVSNERLGRAVRAWGEEEEFRAAQEENLSLQRQLAKIEDMPVAYTLEGIPQWDIGAPMPHVFSSGHKTILLYYLADPDPDWDQTYVKAVSTQSADVAHIALLEFQGCYSFRFGGANDEVVEGHPLWGKGLEPYRPHRVENSPWLLEEMRINSVHSQHNPSSWKGLKHFLFLFHDELFECLAAGFNISVKAGNFQEVAQYAYDSITGIVRHGA